MNRSVRGRRPKLMCFSSQLVVVAGATDSAACGCKSFAARYNMMVLPVANGMFRKKSSRTPSPFRKLVSVVALPPMAESMGLFAYARI